MEKNQTYKIGEAARLANVNKDTIRYYEKRGLISKPGRRRSGYRIFTRFHIRQLKFIKRAKQLGFTLSEIKELMELRNDEGSSCSSFNDEARKKRDSVSQKIESLIRIRNTLDELIHSCNEESTNSNCPILRALEGENRTGADLKP